MMGFVHFVSIFWLWFVIVDYFVSVRWFSLNISGAGWDVDEELDIPVDVLPVAEGKEETGYFVPPPAGKSLPANWTTNSQLAVDHVLAGSFDTACRLLNDQIGVVSFAPLQDTMTSLFQHSRALYQPLPITAPLYAYPMRNWSDHGVKHLSPAVVGQLSELVERLQQCYQLTTTGKFQEALEKLRKIMWQIPLLVVAGRQEQAEATQLLEIAREYALGLSMELARKDLPKESLDDQRRSCEVGKFDGFRVEIFQKNISRTAFLDPR